MSEEVGHHLAFTPEVDGEGDGVKTDLNRAEQEAQQIYRSMSQEKSTKIDPLNLMEHGVETSNLADVIADGVEQASGDIRFRERPLLIWIQLKVTLAATPKFGSHLDDLAKAGGYEVCRQTKEGVITAIDILHQHVHLPASTQHMV